MPLDPPPAVLQVARKVEKIVLQETAPPVVDSRNDSTSHGYLSTSELFTCQDISRESRDSTLKDAKRALSGVMVYLDLFFKIDGNVVTFWNYRSLRSVRTESLTFESPVQTLAFSRPRIGDRNQYVMLVITNKDAQLWSVHHDASKRESFDIESRSHRSRFLPDCAALSAQIKGDKPGIPLGFWSILSGRFEGRRSRVYILHGA